MEFALIRAHNIIILVEVMLGAIRATKERHFDIYKMIV